MSRDCADRSKRAAGKNEIRLEFPLPEFHACTHSRHETNVGYLDVLICGETMPLTLVCRLLMEFLDGWLGVSSVIS